MLHKLRMRAQDEKGFTLIELLVVILIIGILAAIALPAFLGQRAKAQDAAAKSDARNMVSQMETCYTDNDTYVGCPGAGNGGLGHERPGRHAHRQRLRRDRDVEVGQHVPDHQGHDDRCPEAHLHGGWLDQGRLPHRPLLVDRPVHHAASRGGPPGPPRLRLTDHSCVGALRV